MALSPWSATTTSTVIGLVSRCPPLTPSVILLHVQAAVGGTSPVLTKEALARRARAAA